MVALVAIINPNFFWMDISCTTEETPHAVYDKELEVLIIVSIETLKNQKSKFGKDKVFMLLPDMIEGNITREIFN